MVIDSCTYIGHWPFRKLSCEKISQTADRAEKAKITHIVCTNLNSIFYIDPMEGNREFLEDLKGYYGKVAVLPFAVINPTYIEWERDLRECAALGFSGVQLTPQYHGYSLYDPRAAKAYQIAGELGLAVKIDIGFENLRQRSQMDTFTDVSGDELASLLSASDKPTTIVSTSFPTSLGDNVINAANQRDNVFFNLIYVDSFTGRQLEDCISKLTTKRLCFGTASPFRYIEPQYVKLFCSGAADSDGLENILYKNLQGKIKGC